MNKVVLCYVKKYDLVGLPDQIGPESSSEAQKAVEEEEAAAEEIAAAWTLEAQPALYFPPAKSRGRGEASDAIDQMSAQVLVVAAVVEEEEEVEVALLASSGQIAAVVVAYSERLHLMTLKIAGTVAV